LLVKSGAQIDVQESRTGKTPLMEACSSLRGCPISVKRLIDLGADPDIISYEGKKAIDYAKEKNIKEVIRILEEYYLVPVHKSAKLP
jgi:ankyrin repeat protein